MFDYIIKNKEWIFSGIGLSVIGLCYLVIRYLFKRKHPLIIKDTPSIVINVTKPEATAIVRENALSEEDTGRIIQELDEMPPLHLDDVTKNYIGLNVDWLVEYWSARKIDDDLIRVNLDLKTKPYHSLTVYCDVNLSEYKQFSILKRGAKVRVIGKIAKFEKHTINLSDVKLFFPK